MLKVSSFYHEKQKSFIPKKNIFLAVFSKHAKIILKDGASRLNFPEGFDLTYDSVHHFGLLNRVFGGTGPPRKIIATLVEPGLS